MIPQFPKFKKLELSDRDEYQAFVSQFEPYSDFNFISLWSYNTEDRCELSLLNGNLVIKMTDYISNDDIFMFLGNEKVDETINKLFTFQKEHLIPVGLKLIPQIVVDNIRDVKEFDIFEDISGHDYVLSVDEHVALTGPDYQKRRNLLKRFQREYEGKWQIELVDVSTRKNQDKFFQVFDVWQESRKKETSETTHERVAIKKFFDGFPAIAPLGFVLQIEGKNKGFSLFEKVHLSYSVVHFLKADVSHHGIFEFLMNQTAIELQKMACRYINFEQDLGNPGLRKTKTLHRPKHYLKKYNIFPK